MAKSPLFTVRGRNAVIFQHAGNEPAGIFEEVLARHNVPFKYVKIFETNEVPDLDSASHLIFMGGPMSVNDEQELPWLCNEKALIRESVAKNRPVLGICLGSQLIASAFGGRVYPSVTENGWRIIRRSGAGLLSGFPDSFRVFQLHGETFDIPQGGTLLCTGDAVRNQALSVGSATGLQFHLEPTRELISDWAQGVPAKDREQISAETPLYLAESKRLAVMLAEKFLGVSR
ncbi:MAG: type 1 glutamine amidotransferase [Methanoregulaceae archaeon]